MHAYTDTQQLFRTPGQLETRQKPRAYCLCTARCCALKRGSVPLSGAERCGPKTAEGNLWMRHFCGNLVGIGATGSLLPKTL